MNRFSHVVITTIAAIQAATGVPTNDESEAVDCGINLPLRGGGHINFRITHDRFTVLFFDVAKRPIAPCAKGATVRFIDASKKNRIYSMVVEGKRLVSRRVVSSRPMSQISLSFLPESSNGTRELFRFNFLC